jgi:hypothetical protein
MPRTDQEVFDHFRADYGPDREIVSLLAYARYAQAKYDWVTHSQAQKNGAAPTDEEVTVWIESLPNSRFREIWNGATEFFNDAAGRYMAARLESERTKETSILSRVDAMAQKVERQTSFRETWLPNIFIAFVSSFALAVFLLVASAIFSHEVTPLGLLKELTGGNR